MTDEDPPIDHDELDFTDDERIRRIDEDRYVVSVDTLADQSEATPQDEPASDPVDQVNSAGVSRWLARSFDDTGFVYGFDATLSVEDEVVRHRLVSNDLSTTFETLVAWFVHNTTTDSTPEEALGILLSGSDLQVNYPSVTVAALAEAHGLSMEDTIGDLARAVDDSGGLTLPPAHVPDEHP